jgi:uncharacterized protein YjbI with pentapeptide repeats
MPIKPRSVSKSGLQPPQLPKAAFADALPGEKLADHAQYTELAVSGCSLVEQAAQQVLFEQVLFRRVNLSRTRLPGVEWRDVRLEACDLSGVEWEKARLRRVELIGCRLVGAKLLDASLEDVLIRNCEGDLALFWSAAFKVARFEHSRLREASFIKADLAGVVFRDCDLSQADLREAKLAGADLRRSIIGGLQVGLRELQGVIIDPTQTAYVASLAGLVIRDEEDPDAQPPTRQS